MQAWRGTAVALLLLLIAPKLALAHGVITESDPPGACPDLTATGLFSAGSECGTLTVLSTAPAEVRLRFSEPVSPFGRGITVLGPGGRPVDRGAVRTDGSDLVVGVEARETGTYTVRWQAVSNDTHPSSGSYRFALGQPGGGPGTERPAAPIGLLLQMAGRWLHFVGYALSFGVLAFSWLTRRPSAIARSPAMPAPGRGGLVSLGIMLLVVAEPIALLGQTASIGPEYMLDPDIMSAALDSTFGRALALRLGAPILLWVLIGMERGGATWALPAAVFIGALMAVLDGFSAHAASGPALALGLLANGLHVGAMGLWVGGFAAWWTARDVPFGPLAGRAVLSLVITGVAMAAVHLTSPGDLLATAYGNTLALKAALVLVTIGAALLARRSGWVSMLSVERAGMGLVLLFAGLLAALPPPR